MCDPCEYCGSERVVPVLDKRIEQSGNAGNKYRTRCLNCQRWLPMTSAEVFNDHQNPHVLPADQDPEADDSTIPLHEYDYADETEALVEKVSGNDQPAMTDGGEVVDDEDEAIEADEAEDLRPVDEHEFECPSTGCEADLSGFPDECDECGAGPFDWPANAAERWRHGELA